MPPFASLLPGVSDPVVSAVPALLADALVPLTGLTVATLLNSLMVYSNGIIDTPKETVMVVIPACAFGRTKIDDT